MGEFSLHSSDITTCVHSHGGDSGYVNVGTKTYIPSYVPWSTTPIPSNYFLMSNPAYIPHGPLGSSSPYNHIFPSSIGIVVSKWYMHPHVSGQKLTYQSYNYVYMVPPSQGIPIYQIPMHPYMGHMGGAYCLTGQGYDLYQNQPYMNQHFQGTWS